jgi:hypothetical protein
VEKIHQSAAAYFEALEAQATAAPAEVAPVEGEVEVVSEPAMDVEEGAEVTDSGESKQASENRETPESSATETTETPETPKNNEPEAAESAGATAEKQETPE